MSKEGKFTKPMHCEYNCLKLNRSEQILTSMLCDYLFSVSLLQHLQLFVGRLQKIIFLFIQKYICLLLLLHRKPPKPNHLFNRKVLFKIHYINKLKILLKIPNTGEEVDNLLMFFVQPLYTISCQPRKKDRLFPVVSHRFSSFHNKGHL